MLVGQLFLVSFVNMADQANFPLDITEVKVVVLVKQMQPTKYSICKNLKSNQSNDVRNGMTKKI